MRKSIIIGAGTGGMAAGIHGQASGYDTRIFEMHTVPGGQRCAWKRKGYAFDGRIHRLFGRSPGTRPNGLWGELGAMPRDLVPTRECASVLSPRGVLRRDFWDLAELEAHLKELPPGDAAVIDGYIRGIKGCAKSALRGDAISGTAADRIKVPPRMLPAARRLRLDMQRFAARLSDPLLRRAFPLLAYSITDMPFIMLHLSKRAYGRQGDIAWPVGGSLESARSMERRCLDLGGAVHYRSKAERMLTAGNRAVGVRPEDGSDHRADVVISNADGRKTILEMLVGRFIDQRVPAWCEAVDDQTPRAVRVFLGAGRGLSVGPSAMVMPLDKPVAIAGRSADSPGLQRYGFDPSMAPEGKGVIKVELGSSSPCWDKLAKGGERYQEEKRKVADTVIGILDASRFPRPSEQVEVIDVPALLTWERYMGGTHGFQNLPAKKQGFSAAFFGKGCATLPGPGDFCPVGVWATMGGALLLNALSGKKAIERICRKDGKRFASTAGHLPSGPTTIPAPRSNDAWFEQRLSNERGERWPR